MTDSTSNTQAGSGGEQQDGSPADDDTAAETGSESPEEGAAAEDAAEDAIIDSDS
jgi:hypothetical protein